MQIILSQVTKHKRVIWAIIAYVLSYVVLSINETYASGIAATLLMLIAALLLGLELMACEPKSSK